MPIRNQKQLFMILLSNVRQNAERTTRTLREISQIAQDPQVEEALEETDSVTEQVLARLDQCFRVIGEKPAKPGGRLHDVLMEGLRGEIADIQSPVARQLFVLAKAIQLIHLRISEYVVLVAVADIAGNQVVKELLESCLDDNLMAVERARRLMQNIVETKASERSAA